MGDYLVAEGLTKRFGLSGPLVSRILTGAEEKTLVAVDNVSLSVEKGTTYALVGESGSGKSTIARMVVGLTRPSSGKVLVDGHDLHDAKLGASEHQKVRRRLQMVFQSPYASLNPRWKIGDILAEPIRAFGLAENADDEAAQVRSLLRQVGLSETDANSHPHEFSGGQRQRISIARALSSRPEFIVCDEPTSALDVSVQAQILNLLKKLQDELGLTYLFISHDLAVVRVMAHNIGVLKNGKLVEEQETDDLIRDPRSDYTRMLLSSAPRLHAR